MIFTRSRDQEIKFLEIKMLIEQDARIISIRSVDMGKDSGDFLTYYLRANCEWVSSV